MNNFFPSKIYIASSGAFQFDTLTPFVYYRISSGTHKIWMKTVQLTSHCQWRERLSWPRELYFIHHTVHWIQNIVYMAYKPGLDTENQLNFVRNYANIFERDFYSRNFCTSFVPWAGFKVGMYGRREVERDRELRIDDEKMGWLSWLNWNTRRWAAWVEIGRHGKLVGSIRIKPSQWNNSKTIKRKWIRNGRVFGSLDTTEFLRSIEDWCSQK